jgi:hypothetical protein
MLTDKGDGRTAEWHCRPCWASFRRKTIPVRKTHAPRSISEEVVDRRLHRRAGWRLGRLEPMLSRYIAQHEGHHRSIRFRSSSSNATLSRQPWRSIKCTWFPFLAGQHRNVRRFGQSDPSLLRLCGATKIGDWRIEKSPLCDFGSTRRKGGTLACVQDGLLLKPGGWSAVSGKGDEK